MTVIRSVLLPFDLTARAAALQVDHASSDHSLVGIADGLAAELEPLIVGALPIPPQKARLTRVGGRCPVHGGWLHFDPWSPQRHWCARCAQPYTGCEHDDWWAMGAQLWTAERAVHAATLFALRGEPGHAALASRILTTLADRYASWPNRDNVLGPSRPFFSTYLESIWLLNASHALALLEAARADGVYALGAAVRDRLLAPSVALVASYHEGASNRQVWNEVAILSALRLLDDGPAIDRRLQSRGGLPWLVEHGLLDDGSWYEGENYHLFAHRGLWYGVQLLQALERPLSAALNARYAAGFLTPFAGVLPDDTFPSRRDSPYAVSIRQWRIAEWCELGYAHLGDARLAGVLTRLYDGSVPAGDTERWRSTADAERNVAPVGLTRADCSWRALLGARVEAPPDTPWQLESTCLRAQGLAVMRRDQARTYVALEGGHDGGGHGHPDRLALTVQTQSARWLEDPGTGSYVDPSLFWYRSTLAHAAPLVNGRSQTAVTGELLAFEDRGGAGWIWKRARDVAPGVTIERTVVVADGYLVDLLEWSSAPVVHDHDRATDSGAGSTAHELLLPIGGAGEVVPSPLWIPVALQRAGGLEDGFEFVRDARAAPLSPRVMFRAQATSAQVTSAQVTSAQVTSAGATSADDAATVQPELSVARVWYASANPGVLLRGHVPGAPEHSATVRHWLRVRGDQGVIAGVWCWPDPDTGAYLVHDVAFALGNTPRIDVTTVDGTRAEHARAPHGWHIELHARHARSSIDLEGLIAPSAVAPLDGMAPGRPPDVAAQGDAAVLVPNVLESAVQGAPGSTVDGAISFLLDAPFYVRTEHTWREADCPTALVQLAATATSFVVDVDARTGPLVVAAAPDDNPMDNERADINSDGVQWYLTDDAAQGWTAAALVVPAAPDAPRCTQLVSSDSTTAGAAAPLATWRQTVTGWALRLVWARERLPRGADATVRFDLIVNERSVDRERRRGQLVLSGGGGFGYLRGDRHEPARSLRLSFV